MRKKRFLSCLLVALVVAVLSVTLVACIEKPSDIITPDTPTTTVSAPQASDLLLTMLKGMGKEGEFVSMDFESIIETNLNAGKKDPSDPSGKTAMEPNWIYHKFYLKGNFMPYTDGRPGEVELGLGVLSCDKAGNLSEDTSSNVELFLKNGRFYLNVGETSLYLEDIDFRWLIEQIRKMQSLQNVVDTILGLIPGLDLGGTEVDELIGIVAMLIFQTDTTMTTYDSETGNGHIAIKFNPDQLITTVVGALGDLSIDSVLGGIGMKLHLPVGENGAMEPVSIDNFLKTLAFPNIDVYVEADFKDGKMQMGSLGDGYKGLRLNVYDYQSDYFHMSTGAFYSDKVVDIIPDNIDKYMPFGLLKFQFDTTFDLDVKNLDAGKLVNFFAGEDLLPEGGAVISSDVNLSVKFAMDIRMKEEPNSANPMQMDDKSIFFLEVYGDDAEPLIGIYLKDRKIYINLDNAINTDSGNIAVKPGNIVIDNVAVSKWLSQLIGNLTDMVAGIIDQVFPPKADTPSAQTFAAVSDAAVKEGYEDVVWAVNVTGDTPQVNNTLGTLIEIISYTAGFNDYLTYNASTGEVNFKVNNEFFHKLCDQFGIQVDALQNMKNFGEVNLGIHVNDAGLKDMYLNADIDKSVIGGDNSKLSVSVLLDNFYFGFGDKRPAMVQTIDNAIGNKEYIGNLKDLMLNALDDIDIEFEAAISITEGTYNLANIFGINTGLPAVDVEVDEDFVLNLKLAIQLQMDEIEGKNGNKEKIVSRARIRITNVKKNVLLPKDNMNITITYLDNRYEGNNLESLPEYSNNAAATGVAYVDMSELSLMQIGIPSFAIGINLTDIINGVIDGIDFGDFRIPDIDIPEFDIPNIGLSDAAAASYSAVAYADGNASTIINDEDIIIAMLNPQTAEVMDKIIDITITSSLIEAVLELANVDIGFDLPTIRLDAEINKIDGIHMSVNANHEGKNLDLSLGINTFKLGVQNVIDIQDLKDKMKADPDMFAAFIDASGLLAGDALPLADILGAAIRAVMNDVDAAFSLNLAVTAGEYNIAEALVKLGLSTEDFGQYAQLISALPNIVVPGGADGKMHVDVKLTLQLQSAFVNVGTEEKKNYQQIITRAKIALSVTGANPIANGTITFMYFDDRYEGNKGLGLPQYEENKKSHGTLYVNLSDFQLMSFQLPDFAVDIDLTQQVNGLIDTLIDSITKKDEQNPEAAAANLFSAVADEQAEAVPFVQVKFTTALVVELLNSFGVQLPDISLPNLSGNVMLHAGEGLSLTISDAYGDKVESLNLKLAFNKLALGANLSDEDIAAIDGIASGKFGGVVNLFDADGKFDYMPLIKAIIYNALNDADVDFNFAISLGAGEYNIAEILKPFGVDLGDMVGISNLPVIKIPNGLNIDLSLIVQIQSEIVDGRQVISRANIELRVNNANDIVKGSIRLLYFDSSYEANADYVQNSEKGIAYLDLSTFQLLSFKLPSFAVNVDLNKVIDSLLTKLFGKNTENGEEAASALLSAVAEGETISPIQVTFAWGLVEELLKVFGLNLQFDLNNDDIKGEISVGQSISLSLDASLAGILVGADLAINKLQLGKQNLKVEVPVDFDKNIFGEAADGIDVDKDGLKIDAKALLKAVIMGAINDTNIEMGLQLTLPAGDYNIDEILALFGLNVGIEGLPIIKLDGDLALDIRLIAKIQSEIVNGKQIISRANIEINFGGNDNPIIGGSLKLLYFDGRFDNNKEYIKGKTNGTLYADLSSFHLLSFSLPNFALDVDLTDAIENELLPNLMLTMFGTAGNGGASGASAKLNAVADTPYKVGAVQVAFTFEFIKELLGLIAPNLSLEFSDDFDLSGEIGLGESIYLAPVITLADKKIEASLWLNALQLGAQNIKIADPEKFDINAYGEAGALFVTDDNGEIVPSAEGLLKAIIYGAFNDADVNMGLNIQFYAGTYNVAEILQTLGLTLPIAGLPSIDVANNFTLGISVKAQIDSEFIDINEDPEVVELKQVVSRANIEIGFGETENAIIGGSIKLFYVDSRVEGNETYVKGSTNGTLYADLSSFHLLSFKLPNFALDVDMNKLIDQMVADLFAPNNDGNGGTAGAAAKLSAVADGVTEQPITSIQLTFTFALIKSLLNSFVNIELPFDINDDALTGNITLGEKVSLVVHADLAGIVLDANLWLDALHLGKQGNGIGIPEGFDKDAYGDAIPLFGEGDSLSAAGLIEAIIYGALDDTDVELGFSITLPAGEYNVDEILAVLGLNMGTEGMPTIVLDGDLTLEIKLIAKIQSEIANVGTADEPVYKQIISRANIEIQIAENAIIGGVMKLLYFDGRDSNNQEYVKGGTNGTLYADLSTFHLLSFSLPNFALDVDFTDILEKKLPGLMDSLFGKGGNGGASGEGAKLGTVADTTVVPAVQVKFTFEFIKELLSFIPNLPFEIPEDFALDMEAGIGLGDRISLDANILLAGKTIEAALWMNKLHLGVQGLQIANPVGFDKNTYGDAEALFVTDDKGELVLSTDNLLRAVIMGAINDTDIEMNLRIALTGGDYNVDEILALFNLVDIPVSNLPLIHIPGDQLVLDVTLKVQVHSELVNISAEGATPVYQQVVRRAKIAIIINTENPIVNGEINLLYFGDLTEAEASTDIKANTLYADLNNFQLLSFKLPSFAVSLDLTEQISKITDNLSESITVAGGTSTRSAYGAVANETGAQEITSVKVKFTFALVRALFSIIGTPLPFEMPNENLTGEISLGKEISLNLDAKLTQSTLGDKIISVGLALKKLYLGSDDVNVEVPSTFNAANYGITQSILTTDANGKLALDVKGLLNAIVYGAIKDTDVQMNLNVFLKGGTYSVSDLAHIFGLDSVDILNGLLQSPNMPTIVIPTDLNMDLTLIAQIHSEIVNVGTEEAAEYKQIISRAKIEIIAEGSNPLVNGSIKLLYVDGRGTGNEGLNKGVTNGTLYADLSTLQLLSFTLPSFAVDIDLTEQIDSIVENIKFGGASEASIASSNYGAVTGEEGGAQVISGVNVVFTFDFIKSLLRELLGVTLQFNLPDGFDFVGVIEIGQIIGLSLSGSIPMNSNLEFSLGLSLEKLYLGAQNINIDVTGIDPAVYGDANEILGDNGNGGVQLDAKALLQAIVYGAINDMDVELAFKLSLQAGDYNIAEILKTFGIDLGITNMPNINLPNDVVLDLSLIVQIQSEMVNINPDENGEPILKQIISRANIEIRVNTPNSVAEGAIKLLYIDGRGAGNEGLNKGVTNGTLYADLSTFRLLSFKLPSFAVDVDLSNIVDTLVPSLLDKIGGGQTENPPAPQQNALAAVADGTLIEPVQLQFTFEFVKELLTILNITLPFDIPADWALNGAISIGQYIALDVNAEVFNKNISLGLALNKLHLASRNVDIQIPAGFDAIDFGNAPEFLTMVFDEQGAFKKFEIDAKALVETIIYGAINDVDAQLNFSIKLREGTYDIPSLLEIFGLGDLLAGLMDIPQIEVPIGSGGLVLDLSLIAQIQSQFINEGTEEAPVYKQIISRARIEIRVNTPNPIINGAIKLMYFDDRCVGNKDNNLPSYVEGVKTHGTVYADLSTFDLLGIRLPSFALDIDLTQTLEEAMPALLNMIFPPATPNPPAPQSAYGAVADGTEKIPAVQIAFVFAFIKELIPTLPFDLPKDYNIRGLISVGESIALDVNVDMSIMGGVDVSLSLGRLHIGANLPEADMELPIVDEAFKSRFGNILAVEDLFTVGKTPEGKLTFTVNKDLLINTLVERAMNDVDIQLSLRVMVEAGDYTLNELLKSFGLNITEPVVINVKERFDLDLTLSIQLKWGELKWTEKDANGKEVTKTATGFTQGKISIVNKVANMLFPQPGEVLKLYYFDERAAVNSTLDKDSYANFKNGVNGKTTYGTLFLDASGFEFAKIKIPSLAVDFDLTKTLRDTIDGILHPTTSGNTGDGEAEQTRRAAGLGTVADGTVAGGADVFSVTLSYKFIESILKQFLGPDTIPTLPEFITGEGNTSATISIKGVNGIELGVGIGSEAILLNVGIDKIHLGAQITQNFADDLKVQGSFDKFGAGVLTDLKSLIYGVLDDAELELNFSLSAPKGKYNLASFLQMAGLKIDELYMNFSEAFNLDLSLNVKLQMEKVPARNERGVIILGEYETILAYAKIALISKQANFIFKNVGTVIGLTYFDSRYWTTGLGGTLQGGLPQYSGHDDVDGNWVVDRSYGTLFGDFSGLSIAGIQIPKVSLDINLTDLIRLAVDQLGTLTGDLTNNEQHGANYGAVADMGAANGLTNYIKVQITVGLLREILNLAGVNLDIELPNFTVDAALDMEQGISVVLNLDAHDVSNGGAINKIDGMLSIPKIELGVQKDNSADAISFPTSEYQVKFADVLGNVLKYGRISGKVNLGANSSVINIQRLLNNLLAASNMTIPLPINLDMNDFANELRLDLQWEFNYEDPSQTKIMLKLTADKMNAFALYLVGGTVYVDMSGLGLPAFQLVDSPIASIITNLVGGAFEGVLDGLMDQIMGGQKKSRDIQTLAADAYGTTPEEMNAQIFAAAVENAEAGAPMTVTDYISMLLNGLILDDGVLKLNIVAETIREVLKELEINIAEEISVDAMIDIFGGKLDLNVHFAEITLGLLLSIDNIGKQEVFTITEIEHATPDELAQKYPSLSLESTEAFVDQLLDVLQPGIWIDLVSKNSAINVNYFKYTKIVTEKVPIEGKTLPYTNGGVAKGGYAAGGSILLSLLRMDGFGGASGIPALYIIVDVNANNIRIRGTTNLLPIDIGNALHADEFLNISIPLNLRQTLRDLLGPIIQGINGAAPTQTVGIEDAFAGFDIMGLLQSVNVKMYGVRNIKINVQLNHNMINELLPKVFKGLVGMEIDLAGKGNKYTVPDLGYDNVNGVAFIKRAWDNLVWPIVKLALADEGLGAFSSLVATAINTNKVDENIQDLMSRLLPFPQLVELNANVYIINGALDNVQLIGYGAKKSGDQAIQRERIELRLFNDMSQQVFFGYMDPVDLNNTRYQAPYIEFGAAVDNEDNFVAKFEEKAYKPQEMKMYYETVRDQNPSYLVTGQPITWKVTYYNANGFDSDNEIVDPIGFYPHGTVPDGQTKMGAFKDENGKWKKGYYIATGTATVAGELGFINVKVVINDNSDILTHSNKANLVVGDVNVRAGASLGDISAITITDTPSGREVYVKNVAASGNLQAVTKFVITSTMPKFTDADEKITVPSTVEITLADGTKIVLPINVIWWNPTFTLLNVEEVVETNILDWRLFYNTHYNINKVQVLTKDGRRIYVDVTNVEAKDKSGNDIFTFTEDVNGNKVVSGFTNKTAWINGFEGSITYTVADESHTKLTRNFKVVPKKATGVIFNAKNLVIINYLQNVSHMPKTGRVLFEDGTSKEYNIDASSWVGVTFGSVNDYSNVSVRFVQDYNFDSFEGNLLTGITVSVVNTTVNYMSLSANGEQYRNISHEDFSDENFGSIDLHYVTSDGSVIDYTDSYSNLTGYTRAPAMKAEGSDMVVDTAANDIFAASAKNAIIARFNNNSNIATIINNLNFNAEFTLNLADLAAKASISVTDAARNMRLALDDIGRLTSGENSGSVEAARWSKVQEEVMNYQILDRGITAGENGGDFRLTVKLFYHSIDSEGIVTMANEDAVVRKYIYFRVAAPASKLN